MPNSPYIPPEPPKVAAATTLIATAIFLGFWYVFFANRWMTAGEYDIAGQHSLGFVKLILFLLSLMILVGVINDANRAVDSRHDDWRSERDRQVKSEQEAAARAQERQRELHNQASHQLSDLRRQAAELKQQADAAEARARQVVS